MNPYDAARQLAKAIRQSDEFKEYINVKEAIDQIEAKKTISDEFRKTQLEVQAMRAMGQDVSDEQMAKLRNLYNLVSADEQVKNLVQLEQRLGQMLSDVHKIIGDALKTD